MTKLPGFHVLSEGTMQSKLGASSLSLAWKDQGKDDLVIIPSMISRPPMDLHAKRSDIRYHEGRRSH